MIARGWLTGKDFRVMPPLLRSTSLPAGTAWMTATILASSPPKPSMTRGGWRMLGRPGLSTWPSRAQAAICNVSWMVAIFKTPTSIHPMDPRNRRGAPLQSRSTPRSSNHRASPAFSAAIASPSVSGRSSSKSSPSQPIARATNPKLSCGLREHHGRRLRRCRATEMPPVPGSLAHPPRPAFAVHGPDLPRGQLGIARRAMSAMGDTP
jgi:hypothetical protein